MSLFPAYSSDTQTDQSASTNATETPSAFSPVSAPSPTNQATSQWLANSSFPLQNEQIKCIAAEGNKVPLSTDTSSTSSSTDTETQLEPKGGTSRKTKKKHKKKKSKKRKRHKEAESENGQLLGVALPADFDGNEQYYVDKKASYEYRTINKLHKPACPRYRHHFSRLLGSHRWSVYLHTDVDRKKSLRRYYQIRKGKENSVDEEGKLSPQSIALDENEYTLRLGQLNRKTLDASNQLQVWLDLIELQDRNPYKWSRLMLAERKLDLVQRALTCHLRNEQLYRLYIDIVSVTYPSFEVTKMLDRLLSKDPYNYTLWTAQIMTTQGSMARCLVPDVLRIYERCMSKMHHSQQQQTSTSSNTTLKSGSSDDVMLRLFNNCALFLRQAGLYEQFFALLKLALELNVSTDQFGDFAPLEEDQRTLIEYEELILQSGLPMNEIWLRIEKLRQGFNFLPCPVTAKSSDPQRTVFNEDVCHYIYPLKSRDNSFYLMLLILRLLKVPFIQCDGLAEKFSARVEHMGDSDAIEDLLAVCLRRSFVLPQQQQDEFLSGLYTLAREMAVSPSFFSNSIGYEIYVRCIKDLLLNCATTYAGIDERKRILFISMWCRFERVLLLLERYSKKLNVEYVKAGRKRFKALLKQPPNRNVLNFYTEFAIYEFEALAPNESITPVQGIFESLIAAHAADEAQSSDICYTYVTYAEILCGRGEVEEALHVLASYALRNDIKNKATIGTAKLLAALQQLTEQLDRHITIERNVEVMVLEQYLLPDHTVSLLKLRVLLQSLIGQKVEALAYLDKLLKIFRANNARHRFLREHTLELYITTMQLHCKSGYISNATMEQKSLAALAEFPRNLFLLQQCGMLNSVPWYRMRAAMLRTQPTILAVTFLLVLARYRFIQMRTAAPISNEVKAVLDWDQRCNELIVRNRILHIFKTLTADEKIQSGVGQCTTYKALQRNALFWRLYLRCLSDQCTAFETSKKCLLTALDECPWSKALYLDGATYVPQELTHLQDLIIEKQLRICALPEELEILREQ